MANVTKTKDATCIQCGTPIKIHIYASPKVAKCDVCKNNVTKTIMHNQDDDMNVYGERTTGPRIDGAPNPALQNLACPYHPDKRMDIIGVIKNDHWGDIVSFQCRAKGCWTVVQISEQARKSGPWRTTVDGTSFEPDDVLEHLKEGKMDEWCEERNVEQRHTTGL